MSTTSVVSASATETRRAGTLDMKLEVVVIPVSDVDRAKSFYTNLGWRLDGDFAVGKDFRVIQVTPPGSPCSVIFGTGITSAVPGSARGLYLVVSDIEPTRAKLVARGVGVSEVFHDASGVFPHAGSEGRVSGPDPGRRSYESFAAFADPDGNGWVLQEVTTRLPGRVDRETTFSSAGELAEALRRAYAEYIVREQAGEELPS